MKARAGYKATDGVIASGEPGEGRTDTARALVLVPLLRSTKPVEGPGGDGAAARLSRSGAARLNEAVSLAEAIDIDVARAETVALNAARAATLFGSGKVDDIADRARELDAGLVIVDHPLTPVQQRNLERAWKAKVIDRTGLILEIFGRRASTREGMLQVELAHLNYQKGRLVRSWTHLERQRGGAGFMGGPGETQIEADRRVLREKVVRLERELERVRCTRKLHRAKRRKARYPVIALVGYTNAGKSTLFNRLTDSGVAAEDMLFATLDPTLRRLRLPRGRSAILSDTVGFISDLPTQLVAAFRATLEEVVEADLILHVRDMSDRDNRAHAADVLNILDALGVNRPGSRAIELIEVRSKIDLLPDGDVVGLAARVKTDTEGKAVPVSALTGEGVDDLLRRIEDAVGRAQKRTVVLKADELSHLAWLHERALVLERTYGGDGSVALDLEIAERDWSAFGRRRAVARRCAGRSGPAEPCQE